MIFHVRYLQKKWKALVNFLYWDALPRKEEVDSNLLIGLGMACPGSSKFG